MNRPETSPAAARPAPVVRLSDAPPGPPPFVLVNMAMTADGRIATANRAHSRFGSARDTAHLHALRATVDAVLCGATTLVAEGATLSPGPARFRRPRRDAGRPEAPLRIAVSGRASLPLDAPIFRAGGSPVILLTTERAPARRVERLRRVATEIWVAGESEVDWPRVLGRLAARHDVRRLLCEGGATVNAGLFRAGLVHELHLTVCPLLVGGRNAPTIADGPGVDRLTEGAHLELRSKRQVGDELFLVFGVPAPGRPATANR